jgi:hypothetical protein
MRRIGEGSERRANERGEGGRGKKEKEKKREENST